MIRPIDTVKRWWRTGEQARRSPESSADTKASAVRTLPPVAEESPWLGSLDRLGIPRSLVYPSTTLGRILDQSADRFGDADALLYNHHRWTYQQLLADVNRMA